MKDRLLDFYDEKYSGETSGTHAEIVKPTACPTSRYEAFMTFFPPRFKGGDVLELGAGSGLIAQSFLALGVPCDSFTLTEYSSSRLAGIAAGMDDPRVNALQLDAENFDPEDLGQFDAVIMVALIEHLIDPLGAMKRIRKLLKPGAFVYIDTPNMAKYTRRAKLLFGRFPATSANNEGLTTYEGKPVALYDEGHLHYFTFRSLSLMLTEQCGFARVEKLGYTCGHRLFGPRIDTKLARWWPELFSELALVAYAD